ncbi:hypothetical protein TR2A62_3162 [Thalassobium sp. R2A62]|nr:hypothetical protein TR2A62_3162 [Thalassobium sp. R2A62]
MPRFFQTRAAAAKKGAMLLPWVNLPSDDPECANPPLVIDPDSAVRGSNGIVAFSVALGALVLS